MLRQESGIKCLIVDDEQEACDNLEHMLLKYVDKQINIAGVANDTMTAEQLIGKVQPDAVFLDIDMPEENAFQFLQRISPYNFEIIFVTAYDEFAIKAFKLNAVDYIQKPICIDELKDSIIKLKGRINYKEVLGYRNSGIDAVKQIAKKGLQDKIVLKTLNHLEIVAFNDIYSIEGQGNYCKICFYKSGANKDMTTSNIIAHYEDLLPAEHFFRVHKSYLINCTHIKDIIAHDNYSIVMRNGETIPVSRRRFPEFLSFLKKHNFHRA